MILDKSKAFMFTIDKDEDAMQRAFRATKELMERIVEAENLAFKNEIEVNAVVINGRKYGMIKDHPGLTPTIFGMKVETRPDMPDEWDFFIQQRQQRQQTNADRIRSMSEKELADWIAQILTYHTRASSNPHKDECHIDCPLYRCCNDQPSDNIEDWLKSQVKEGEG